MLSSIPTSLHSLPSCSSTHFFFVKYMANCILLPPRDLWPVGFRFHPTDDELINHYLKNKTLGQESLVQYIPQVDICKFEPWELPGLSNDDTGEQQWFFFSAQDFKHSNGRRSNRTTREGYWKSTGKDRKIMALGTKTLIGTKKTLVFHLGRVSNGIGTNWVIHEYRLHSDANSAHLKSFVICRLKRNLDRNDALICNEADSTFENVGGTVDEIQEISGNGQSWFQPDLQVSDYDIPDMFSDPEPTSMDFQATNSYGTHVNGPSDEDIDPDEFFNSILVDDENCSYEGTPNGSINYFNYEEVLQLVSQGPGGGFSGMSSASDWQNDHASRGEHTHSRVQTQRMPMINKARRCPLTSKILKCEVEKKDLSSPRPCDDSDKEMVYHQSLETKTQLRVVSSHVKAEAVAKRIKVEPAKTSNKYSIEDQESEVENSLANRFKSTGSWCLESRVSSILTTKCIHHKSSPASAYVARACLGFILFIVIAREVLLYGDW